MSSAALATTVSFLELARSGRPERGAEMSEEAFAAVYWRTASGLRGFVRRSLGAVDSGVVEDVMQEAYLRFLRSGFESSEPRVERGYLFTIAANLMRDRFRRARPEEELVVEPAAQQPREGLRRDVSRLFARLAVKERQLLWLAHVEQRSHREVAEILGLRETSVRVLLLRARRRLACLLEHEGIGPEVLS
ncbi:MAG TPA: RNA polymerase sigma factor [Thermoanaerobaculia bacterium]|nr:RNA polymerase sigma factor [Thermoanaerobaculia bacterium]